jgi:hypothetical protein
MNSRTFAMPYEIFELKSDAVYSFFLSTVRGHQKLRLYKLWYNIKRVVHLQENDYQIRKIYFGKDEQTGGLGYYMMEPTIHILDEVHMNQFISIKL